MTFSNLSKIAGAGVLAASLSMAALTQPASAQTTTGSDSSNTTSTTDTTTRQDVNSANYNRDNGFDWGWLGLLGLAGLAGLAGKKQEEPTRYREPDEVSSSSYRR